jgi:hypothetical protein
LVQDAYYQGATFIRELSYLKRQAETLRQIAANAGDPIFAARLLELAESWEVLVEARRISPERAPPLAPI